MVNTEGQLFTIEGIAAAMIMLLTAYIVLGATSIYTPGDTHISDMQLEQLGTDALQMMNTPPNSSVGNSSLQRIVYDNNSALFRTVFLNYINNKTGSQSENLQYYANVTYRNPTDNSTGSYTLSFSRNLTGSEHAVKVTEWVTVKKRIASNSLNNRTVLVEVLLWRD